MTFIVDTGPLIAALDNAEARHPWAAATLRALPAPLGTCEAVIAEAVYLLRSRRQPVEGLFELLATGALRVDFDLQAEHEAVSRLMRRYAPRMDLADGCIVRMSELQSKAKVVTLDSDFLFYRRHLRRLIPVIIPDRH